MSEIEIVEKPDWISWDDIHQCLWEAHKRNRERGITMRTTLLSGDELRRRIQHDSFNYKTYVLLDGKKLIGTGSVSIRQKKAWYVNGSVAYFLCNGIIPEYTGRGLNKLLYQKREEFGHMNNCILIYYDTAEGNKFKQEIDIKKGFRKVDYFASKSKHYSVVLAKWYGECPYSKLYCRIRFLLKKVYIQLRFKPGKIRRLI